MSRILFISLLPLLAFGTSMAASKSHVVVFSKPLIVKWYTGSSEETVTELRVRALIVDGKQREYSTGPVHEVTERLLVVRAALRVNDSLPADIDPRWKWERAGWLLVDRATGKVSSLNLPDFDPYFSEGTWYRDYVAYCSAPERGQRVYAVVAQLGRHKPLLRKLIDSATLSESPGSACPAPTWSRNPARVAFQTNDGNKLSFTLHRGTRDAVESGDLQDSE